MRDSLASTTIGAVSSTSGALSLSDVYGTARPLTVNVPNAPRAASISTVTEQKADVSYAEPEPSLFPEGPCVLLSDTATSVALDLGSASSDLNCLGGGISASATAIVTAKIASMPSVEPRFRTLSPHYGPGENVPCPCVASRLAISFPVTWPLNTPIMSFVAQEKSVP
jgi:hypothetical protein